MSYEVEKIQYKGHTIRLIQDEDAQSPREDDNVGAILYTSSRYVLGDKQVAREEIDAIVKDSNNIWLPVFAYIHSGTSLSTRSFKGRAHHAEWDSGQCGIIYCTKAKAVYEWGKKLCTKQVIEKAENYLKGEIETFNSFLNGEVVGYEIEGPLSDDSCWGYYPENDKPYSERYAYCVSEAKSAIDYERREKAKQLKAERIATKLEREQHLALV